MSYPDYSEGSHVMDEEKDNTTFGMKVLSDISEQKDSLNLIKDQLSQVLIYQVLQKEEIDKLKNDIEFLSSNNMALDRVVRTVDAKLNDMQANVDRLDDTNQNINENVMSLQTDIQELQAAVANIKIYRSVNDDII